MAADSTFIKNVRSRSRQVRIHADKEPVMDWLTAVHHWRVLGLMAQFGPYVQDVVFHGAALRIFLGRSSLILVLPSDVDVRPAGPTKME